MDISSPDMGVAAILVMRPGYNKLALPRPKKSPYENQSSFGPVVIEMFENVDKVICILLLRQITRWLWGPRLLT